MKNRVTFLFILILSASCAFAQNAIVGSGFTNGWSTTGNFEYFTGSAGSSYIKTDNANGTGYQYFRMGIDWSGTTGQYTITPGSDIQVSPNTEIQLNSGSTGSGSMFLNVTSTSHNYVFKTKDAGSAPSFKLIIFNVQGTVRSVSGVSKDLASVYPGQTVVVTATLDGSFSTGQGVYLRYTNDNFSTSTVIAMTGSGTTYTASIPAGINTPSAGIKYYVFTSGNGLTISGTNADWYTINLNNSSGNNYSYTVNTSWTTNSDGSWSSTGTWAGGVIPISGQPVTIAHNVTLNQDATVSSILINSGNSLTINTGYILQSGGAITATGALTVDGTLQLNAGGYLATNAPTYSSGSTFIYNTGAATYNRSNEWSSGTTGQGVPYNLKVETGSSVNMDIAGTIADARTVRGNLTLKGSLSFKGSSNGNLGTVGGLTINGDLSMAGGTLTMGHYISPNGSDLILYGNWNRTSGSFVGNGRAVFMDGSTNTDITTNTATVINYLYIRKTGSSSVTLNNELQIANVGVVNSGATLNCGTNFITGAGTFTLSAGATLGIGSPDGIAPGSSGNIQVSGIRTFDPGANYIFNGSSAQVTGTLLPAIVNNFTIDNAAGVKLSNTALTVNGTLLINTGKLFTIESGKQVTVPVTGTLTNNATATGLVIQSDASGTGSLLHTTSGVPATVNRYIPGSSTAWHLLSSPVASQAISPNFIAGTSTDYDFFCWYEPTGTWVNFKNTTVAPTWNTANINTNFMTGRGYLVEYKATTPTKQYSGNLNAGTVTYPVAKSLTGTYAGFNLAGNPYPSAIDWKAASGWNRSSLVTNSGGYDMSIWNDADGQYGTFNSTGTSGTHGVTQYIPVGQGFMVKASAAGNLIMNDNVRVHNPAPYLKTDEQIANILRLRVTGKANSYTDEVVVEFGHQDFTGGGEKMFSFYETAPSLYTVKPTGNYSIDFRGEPGAVTIPMSFKAGVDGNYTLTASQFESFPSSSMITLEDLKVARSQNLMQNPVYTFTAIKNDTEARFLLHFGGAFSVNDKENGQPVAIYASGNSVYIANKTGALLKGSVLVYNMVGQQMMNLQLSEDPLTKIILRGTTGYYLVKVVTSDHAYSGKVFIK